MYSILVLGQIPGTGIQISFQAWLVMAALLAVTIACWRAFPGVRRFFVRQGRRMGVEASQLHLRAQ